MEHSCLRLPKFEGKRVGKPFQPRSALEVQEAAVDGNSLCRIGVEAGYVACDGGKVVISCHAPNVSPCESLDAFNRVWSVAYCVPGAYRRIELPGVLEYCLKRSKVAMDIRNNEGPQCSHSFHGVSVVINGFRDGNP